MKVPSVELNELVNEYDFPLPVIEDVFFRMMCNKEDAYVLQQVRYLKNLINTGNIRKKVPHA